MFPSVREQERKPLTPRHLSRTICDRRQRLPVLPSQTASGSGFTIFATHSATGW